MADWLADEPTVITVTHSGYIKRCPVAAFRAQHRGGVGVRGIAMKEEDFVEHVFTASTHDYLLVFTANGRVYWLKVYQIPQGGRAAKGKAVVNLINITLGERMAAILPIRDFAEGKSIVMVTKKGIVKKTELAAFSNPRTGGIIAMSVDEGDDLIDVQLTLGNQELFMGTRKGMAIRFKEEDVRDMGRAARGVIGIRMDEDDVVVGVEIPTEGNSVVTVSEKGFGKRTSVSEYRLQSRGGKGIINLKTVPRVGNVSGILQVTGDEDIMLISDTGNIIRVKVESVPLIHRSTQGVKLIDLEPEERLVGMARAEREEEKEEDGIDLPEEITEEDTEEPI